MPSPTHIGPARLGSSYDGRGLFTEAPKALAGSVRLAAGGPPRRVVGLPAPRRLVPAPRRESPAAPRTSERPARTVPAGHQLGLPAAGYLGVRRSHEQGRPISPMRARRRAVPASAGAGPS